MLSRLGRTSKSATSSGEAAALALRLEKALEARDASEQALALAGIEKVELQARVAELEGAPAARELAAQRRAAEGSQAQLVAAREAAAHERDVLHDEVAEQQRGASQLEFRLRTAERLAKEHEASAKRAAAELEATRLALVDERKARYLAEDALRAAETKGSGAAASRAHQAELQLAQMAEEARAREAELGKARGALEATSTERDALRAQLADALSEGSARGAALAELNATLALVREALGPEALGPEAADGTAVDVTDASGSGSGSGSGSSARDAVHSLAGLVRTLRQQASHGEALEAAALASDAAAAEARRQADTAGQRAAVVEAQLSEVQRRLQESESLRLEMERDRTVPVLDPQTVVEERDEQIFELRHRVVPSLEQRAADAQAMLARVEARLQSEREAKTDALAAAAKASEAGRAATEQAHQDRMQAEAAERARSLAEERARQLETRCSSLEAEVEAWRRKEGAYRVRESEVAEAVGTADVRTSLLEEQVGSSGA
jgi:chromosome segregation ATPase